MQDKKLLIMLVRTLEDYQFQRIRVSNRIKIKKDKKIQKDAVMTISKDDLLYMNELITETKLKEKEIEKKIKSELKKYSIYTEWLKGVKGVGHILAGYMLSEINIDIATNVSKIWAFCGMDPNRSKLVKGEKSCFNKKLKSKLLGVLGSSFLKSKSEYSKIYYDDKHRLESEHPEQSLLHRHRQANRKMVKLFLTDLYVNWRTLEGLTVREPYKEEYLGRKHIA